jgi:hypothetical protein
MPIYRPTKHTLLTALAEDGVAKEDVRTLARHRDERTTNRYILEDDARRRRAMERLEVLDEAAGRQAGDRASIAKIAPKPRDIGA